MCIYLYIAFLTIQFFTILRQFPCLDTGVNIKFTDSQGLSAVQVVVAHRVCGLSLCYTEMFFHIWNKIFS